MIYLFIHQNFPGQYKHIVAHLANKPGNTVYFISQPTTREIPGVHKITYSVRHPTTYTGHPLSQDIDRAVRAGAAVADVCRMLKSQGVKPDIVVGHSGWGETLFVKDVFTDVPLLAYFEFYYHLDGADLDFDPEFSVVFGDKSRLRTRNAINLMAFESCDWGHTPTKWQHSLHPADMRKRMTVLHEGVDTDVVRPDPDAVLAIPGKNLTLTAKDEVVTYVSRNLEPYRGFHVFMRALPKLMKKRPKAHIVIVGGDGVSYGMPAPPRSTYRQMMLEELGDQLDLNRIHFLGQIEYQQYLKVLQVSSAHVYLTYPFILSWSFIEAMAAGCLLIGSRTAPVMEVLKHGRNGMAVDFFDIDALADRMRSALETRGKLQRLRETARREAVRLFDLRRRATPTWEKLLTRSAERAR